MDGLPLFYVSFQNIHSVAQYKVIILSYFKKTVVKLYLTQVYDSVLILCFTILPQSYKIY